MLQSHRSARSWNPCASAVNLAISRVHSLENWGELRKAKENESVPNPLARRYVFVPSSHVSRVKRYGTVFMIPNLERPLDNLVTLSDVHDVLYDVFYDATRPLVPGKSRAWNVSDV
jgi:hypothetical protein